MIARNREAQISRVAGGSPKVKLTPEQRSQQVCCVQQAVGMRPREGTLQCCVKAPVPACS